jgi:uncharacterized protein (TIGR03382 family)
LTLPRTTQFNPSRGSSRVSCSSSGSASLHFWALAAVKAWLRRSK